MRSRHKRSAEPAFTCSGCGGPLRKVMLASLLLLGWMDGSTAQESAKPVVPSVALPPVVPASGPGRLVVSCDPGGCWDEFGVRYDRADAGVFVRVDGRSCLMTKGRMHCE